MNRNKYLAVFAMLAVLVGGAAFLLASCELDSPYLEVIQERIEEDEEEAGLIPSYSVLYNGNGNTGGLAPTDSTEYIEGDTATILGNTNGLVKTGYTFVGWNTIADKTGLYYYEADTFTIQNSNVSLYAVWELIPPTEVSFLSAVQTGGSSGSAESTGLTLTFDVDPITLTVDEVTVTGALKGVLFGSGTTRSLSISNITVADGETVEVEITSPTGYSIAGSPQTAVVYRYNPVVFQNADQIGGSSGTVDSTGLRLTFDIDPETLTVDNITINGATKGSLSGTGTTRTLTISNITVGNGEQVTVTISSPAGYSLTGSQQAIVYRAPYVGMRYQGGIIAYILQPGEDGYVSGQTHGLIAATADQSTGIQWYNGSWLTTEATGTAIGTGQDNTTKIVNVQGVGSYAAYFCYDYTNIDTGTGSYSDWYLPSQDELTKLWDNRDSIGGFNSTSTGYYWSSTESSSSGTDIAWLRWFGSVNLSGTELKSRARFVRAVRSF